MDREELKKEFSSREFQRILVLILIIRCRYRTEKKEHYRKQQAGQFVGGHFRSDKPRKQASLFQRVLLRTGVLSNDIRVRQVND